MNLCVSLFFFWLFTHAIDELTEKCLPNNEETLRGKCGAEQFQCKSGECIPSDNLCDGNKGIFYVFHFVCLCVSLFGQIYRLICLFIDLQNVKMHPTKPLNIAHQNAVHRLVFDVVTVLALMKGHDVTEMSIVSTNPMRIICCAVIQKVADHHQQRLLPQQLDHLQVMLIQQRLYSSCHHSILHQVK